MVDGARNALLGYLYQLLGTATLKVRDVPSAADAWAQIIARVDSGAVLSEEFGQDATIHPAAALDRGVTAIQFKHSATAGSLIERYELIDILVALDRSRHEAESRSVLIEHYAIVTNRRLDPSAQAIVEYQTNPSPHPSLNLRTATDKGKPIEGNVKRLKPYGGDPAAAAAAWHSVIQALKVFPGETFEADVDRLRQFAARYGVLDREWTQSLDSLIGALIRETTEGRTFDITLAWLKEHLIGDEAAANLQFGCPFTPHISNVCRERLEERAKRQHTIRPQDYLERQIQQEIQDQTQQYPVVFVSGGGGSGKSLAVVNFLRSIADRQLIWTEGAITATEELLVREVTAVRLPKGGRAGVDQYLGDVFARLTIANGNRRPLWTIDLDGIDEAPERVAPIRTLINLCWARGSRDASPASLVASCRAEAGYRSKEDLVAQWLDTPEPGLVDGIGFVELGDFTDQEIVDAARLLNGTPERRIIWEGTRSAGAVRHDFAPVPDQILLSLRHPVVWGGYASLPEAERNGVLDGERIHLDHLAERFCVRFLVRCRTRKRWRDAQGLESALKKVAHATNIRRPPYSIDDWDQASQVCLDRAEARDLYHESLSYGLIKREASRSWRWGHPFLADYLASVLGGGTHE